MPARHSINLLPKDAFASSVGGRLLFFSLTIGRYIVIFTELVVIAAFLSRFFLDRRMSDLNDKIREQTVVLDVNKEFEQDFRFDQARLKTAEGLIGNQIEAVSLLGKLTPLVSPEVTVSRVSIQGEVLSLSGTSATALGIKQTTNNFQKSMWLSEVAVTGISTGSSTGGEVRFVITARVNLGKMKGGS